MTDAQIRLECLRIAAGLRNTTGTQLPTGLVPAIIADASAFADFALGDEEPVDEPDVRPVVIGGHVSSTGGFRAGPASEP